MRVRLIIPDRASGGPLGPERLAEALTSRGHEVVRADATPAVGDVGLVWTSLPATPPERPTGPYALLIPEFDLPGLLGWRDLAQGAAAVLTLDPSAPGPLARALKVAAVPVLGGGKLDLDTWSPLSRAAARAQLGVEPRKILALTGPLEDGVRLDLLGLAHRRLPGVALFIVGTGPSEGRVGALETMTRPSSPILHVPTHDPEARRMALAACDVALHLHEATLGEDPMAAAAMGRRLVALDSAAGLGALDALYPGTTWPIRASSTPEGLRNALTAALEDPDPSPEAVRAARLSVGQGAAVDQLLEVLSQCASPS